MKKVQILLACYNGEKYLSEQIDSLLAQSYPNLEILARDDGSTDSTPKILNDYARRNPHQFKILPSSDRLGVIGNFSKLMEFCTADYILFSDQDDVWLKDKVQLSISSLLKAEKRYSPFTPILVHTDLKITDSKNEIVHPSFWNYASLKPFNGKTLNRLLVQNCVTGCTIAMNRALLSIATPIPPEVRMHDWWLALVAASTGKIFALADQTILYRQHGSNTLGAKKIGIKSYAAKGLQILKNPNLITDNILKLEKQAHALYKRCEGFMSEPKRTLLNNYLCSPELSMIARKRAYLKHRFFRHSPLINFLRFFLPRPF